jgi:branched-subunit amino acid transport protein
MSATVWWTVAGCALMTALIKAAGPLAVGGRPLPPRAVRVVALLAPALLAALVVTSALADGRELHVGADTAGVVAAGLVVWSRKGGVLAAVVVAAAVTALLRAVT